MKTLSSHKYKSKLYKLPLQTDVFWSHTENIRENFTATEEVGIGEKVSNLLPLQRITERFAALNYLNVFVYFSKCFYSSFKKYFLAEKYLAGTSLPTPDLDIKQLKKNTLFVRSIQHQSLQFAEWFYQGKRKESWLQPSCLLSQYCFKQVS